MILGIGILFLQQGNWLIPATSRSIIYGRVSVLFVLSYLIFLIIGLNNLNWLDNQTLYDGLLSQNGTIQGNEFYVMLISQLVQYTTINYQKRSEIYLIILSGLVGVINLISSNDQLVSQLSLQQINLSFYFLLSIEKTSEAAMSAALKYLLLSAFTTTLFLFSIALLYGIYGTVNIEYLRFTSLYANAGHSWAILQQLSSQQFKLGAAPFYNWIADVYEGSPTAITIFLATIPKVAILAFILNIKELLQIDTEIISFAAVLSLLVGSIGLGFQTRFKRIIAFSTVSHMGFILLALINADFTSLIFYYIIYALTTVNVFTIQLNCKTSTISGIYLLNPALAISLAICFFSLAGIPPLGGFFAKIYVLLNLMYNHDYLLATLAIITSTISTGYYIRVIKKSYLEIPVNSSDSLVQNNSSSLVVSILTFFQTFFLFKFESLIYLTSLLFSIN